MKYRAFRTRLPGLLISACCGLINLATATAAFAEPRNFSLRIEDTTVTLVDKQTFHTFSFNGQTPGPLMHVKEGDDVQVEVENQTTLPHTIHWHGLYQRGNWQNDGVPDVTQPAIAPGETFTYRFKAEKAGTMWYHCHVNVNEHVAMRACGAVDHRPQDAVAGRGVPRVHHDVLQLGIVNGPASPARRRAGDEADFFTINGKAFPIPSRSGSRRGMSFAFRLIGAGDEIHSIHPRHDFEIFAKDGRPLASPIMADTILFGPGDVTT
jgi:FtsP/CotA-like multicopper oxidase with cupredoxin domain